VLIWVCGPWAANSAEDFAAFKTKCAAQAAANSDLVDEVKLNPQLARGAMQGAKGVQRRASVTSAIPWGVLYKTAVTLQRSYRAARRRAEQRRVAMAEHARNQTARSRAALMLQTFFRASIGRARARARRQARQAECLCAIRTGSAAWCRELCEHKGVSVHFRDARGSTPLHHAAAAGRDAVVEELIKLGADVNAVDAKCVPAAPQLCRCVASAGLTRLLFRRSGRTPLHTACLVRAADCARRLALSGSDIDACDRRAAAAPHPLLLLSLQVPRRDASSAVAGACRAAGLAPPSGGGSPRAGPWQVGLYTMLAPGTFPPPNFGPGGIFRMAKNLPSRPTSSHML
jgi:hypothetical protein